MIITYSYPIYCFLSAEDGNNISWQLDALPYCSIMLISDLNVLYRCYSCRSQELLFFVLAAVSNQLMYVFHRKTIAAVSKFRRYVRVHQIKLILRDEVLILNISLHNLSEQCVLPRPEAHAPVLYTGHVTNLTLPYLFPFFVLVRVAMA